MIKFLKWLVKGRPYITYEGYHCGCCGHWENEQFSIPAYKSGGRWADIWGLCSKCRRTYKRGKDIENERCRKRRL